MHNKLFLLSLALLSCHILFAQNQEPDQWVFNSVQHTDASYRITVGPKAGAGLALGSSLTAYDFSLHSGFAYQAGAAANVHFGRRIGENLGGTGWMGVEAEVLYCGRSIATDLGPMSLACIEIPVLLQVYPLPSLAIETGPTFVKILKCSPDKMQYGDLLFNTGQLTGGDMMLTLGASYKTDLGLLFGVRYNMGLSPLAGNFDAKISTAVVSVAYMFDFMKNQ